MPGRDAAARAGAAARAPIWGTQCARASARARRNPPASSAARPARSGRGRTTRRRRARAIPSRRTARRAAGSHRGRRHASGQYRRWASRGPFISISSAGPRTPADGDPPDGAPEHGRGAVDVLPGHRAGIAAGSNRAVPDLEPRPGSTSTAPRPCSGAPSGGSPSAGVLGPADEIEMNGPGPPPAILRCVSPSSMTTSGTPSSSPNWESLGRDVVVSFFHAPIERAELAGGVRRARADARAHSIPQMVLLELLVHDRHAQRVGRRRLPAQPRVVVCGTGLGAACAPGCQARLRSRARFREASSA